MNIADNYLLGMDLGTTNVKAMIMDENGNVAASASRANSLIVPEPNNAEQDANLWWKNTVEILQEVTRKAGSEIVKKIRGISVSSQTVTMLPVDTEGTPLRNAIIWMDGRSGKQLKYIIDQIGFERYVSIIGGQPDTGFLPNKILWFKENEPELFAKTHKILQASSYINYKLTGKMTMDIDQAGKSQCLDMTSLQWSEEISRVIGADLNQFLPRPQQINEIIGTVTEETAAETGLVSGIPVAAGASDAIASMYAMGLSRIGDAGESSGTSSLVFAGSMTKTSTTLPLVAKPFSIDGMPYIFDAPISASGASLKWYLDTLGKPEKEYAEANNISVFEYLNRLAADAIPGSNGLIFFPYLYGERAPLWNSYAKGMFIGISRDTTREEIIRSIFEGTAFALRHVMEIIKDAGGQATTLRITGGGAKSRTWSQIKASMLRMPIYILDERSGDVPFGDALIAGNAVGVFPDLTETMSRLIRVKEVIKPNEEWTDVYDKMYPFYISMYKNLDTDLKKFQTI